ncbi:hypothetical protein N7474_001395 [Penicillium riverlandense]|uniref:uncharacterized protein n=1 Tax=Penicillium riverlandense TaxID=1903569 RepID=UPI002548AB8A|nr:uncharacterized protein N7474_001395 [Penicillium riverlandense]KAJ5833084.1 hypothetical protein N7474_001395 [Penicillium riverlandense]
MNKQWDALKDIPDLHGKVVVVTGGSNGIGFETVRLLAQRGAKVYFTSRSESKARNAKDILQTNYPDIEANNIDWLLLDLSDLKSIDAAAHALNEKESKVDILINNAAYSTLSNELLYGRWEQHLAVNYIGPFFFVNRVMPLLKNALKAKDADVRIINLSSLAQVTMLPQNFEFHFDSTDCLRNPVRAHPWQWRYIGRFMFGFDLIRYAVSKAAVALFTKELQRRLDEQGLPIVSVAVHPGEVATEGLMIVNYLFIRTIARLFFLASEQGAATSAFAATAIEVRQNIENYKGKFLVPVGKVESPNAVVEDDKQIKGLWETTNMEVNEQLVTEGLAPLDMW